MTGRDGHVARGLSAADLALLVELVREAHRAHAVAGFPDLAIQLVRRAVPSDIVSFNDVDPGSRHITFVIEPPGSTDGVADPQGTFARLQHHNPMLVHSATTGDGSARKLSDFLSPEQLHANPLYRELYRPMGVEHQIAFALPVLAPRIVAIALNRSAASGDFGERDRAMLDELRPHLAQAYALVAEREQVRLLLAPGRDRDPRGRHVVLLTDPPRSVTPGALAVLADAYGDASGDAPGSVTTVPDRVAAWVADQRHHLLAASGPELLEPLVTTFGGRGLVIRYVPDFLAPDALVAEEATDLAASGLDRLGLTTRESEVLALVATGATNALVAAELGIAPGTVKRHLDNVYRKLGVHGRMQAVALTRDLTAGGLRRTAH